MKKLLILAFAILAVLAILAPPFVAAAPDLSPVYTTACALEAQAAQPLAIHATAGGHYNYSYANFGVNFYDVKTNQAETLDLSGVGGPLKYPLLT